MNGERARTLLASVLLSAAAGGAHANLLTANLNQISSATIGSGTLGTVTVTDIAGGVLLDAILNNGTFFVDTGNSNSHTGFAYNVNQSPTSVQIDTPPTPSGIFTVLTGSQTATPYGTFSNGLRCNGCGPGAANKNPGPLELTIQGITTANFVGNTSYFFAADVFGPNGATGEIAANAITLTETGVPEPTSMAVLAAGVLGLGLLRKRG